MNNEEKILELLFEEPTREFHIRLLARLTNLHPNTIINITNKLVKQGFIAKYKNKDNNLVIIKPNIQNIFYKLRKQFYNINKIYQSGLIDYLNDLIGYPTIILFGSYAKSENHKESDIDLFILTEGKQKLDLKKYESKLNAEIQIFMHTNNELNNLKKNSPELINNIINGYKLSGYLEVF